jgi:hypothetical protein
MQPAVGASASRSGSGTGGILFSSSSGLAKSLAFQHVLALAPTLVYFGKGSGIEASA